MKPANYQMYVEYALEILATPNNGETVDTVAGYVARSFRLSIADPVEFRADIRRAYLARQRAA